MAYFKVIYVSVFTQKVLEGKVVPCLNKRHAMQTYGELEV